MTSFSLFAQHTERYVRAGILLEGRDIAELAKLGIETDHGLYLPGALLVADLAEWELEQVRRAGFSVKIWIDDLQKDYEERLRQTEGRNFPCPSGQVGLYSTPQHYTYGSMGGYHTLDEMMAVLDDMHAKFPHLISPRLPLTSAPAHTWEGRRIWYVRISDNPDLKEGEPEVLYTALHHAREPNSASQMLYFMWFLLENYAIDPQIRYIVDNAELYFIPCLNPDGYVFNQTSNPNGGGFWRKNRRLNQDGSFGVDLNRNYAYFWGMNNAGSSPIPSSQTYRGPEPFSEPELQALRDFMLEHDFIFVQNYHTHGNLLIYPWGYDNTIASSAFLNYAHLFAKENNYRTGTAGQTVGYAVNGVSDDWMYAALGAYALTPEVGTTGFWPTPNQIEDLNRDCLWMNLATALCALHHGEAQDLSTPFLSSLNPSLTIEFMRYGLQEGLFTLSLTPLTPNVSAVYPPTYEITPDLFEKVFLNFDLQLSSSVTVGEEVLLQLQVSNGIYTHTQVLRKTYGGVTMPVFADSGTSLSQWSGNWGITQSAFCSAPSAFTDSPDGPYPPNANLELVSMPISLPPNAGAPRLRFCARWEIEPSFDYVQVRAFNSSLNVPLCGRYTKPGAVLQPTREPIYDAQQEWVEESMDLSAFVGQTFRVSFTLNSDIDVQLDGFYMDDIVVEYDDPTIVATPEPSLSAQVTLWCHPNPAEECTYVNWENTTRTSGPAFIVVHDALGRLVEHRPLDLSVQRSVRITTAQWPSGLYFVRLEGAEASSSPYRLMVLHR